MADPIALADVRDRVRFRVAVALGADVETGVTLARRYGLRLTLYPGLRTGAEPDPFDPHGVRLCPMLYQAALACY
jgi:hypothetical protein